MAGSRPQTVSLSCLNCILRQMTFGVAEWLLQCQPSCSLHYNSTFSRRESFSSYYSLRNMIEVLGLFLAQIGLPAYVLANHHSQGYGRC